MPAIRICKTCGQKNRLAANHLADTGRCGACKSPLPPLDEPLQVDTDKHQQLAARFAVRGIPNFAVFSAGKLVRQQAGMVDHNVMEGWLKSAALAASA